MQNPFILFSLITIQLFSQEITHFNFGFEEHKDENSLSDGWYKWGDYKLSNDTISHSGKFSGKITSSEHLSFGCIVYRFPAQYSGKKIRLEGFIKIKDVKEGYAGLVIRINGETTAIAYEDMELDDISGTIDWKKYSIELDYDQEEASKIYIGGKLSGKGEAWFDDLQVFIDDTPIQNLKIIEKQILPIDLDKEFDTSST